ncbi:MAG: hypothetical protein ACXWUG_09555 [Polyangiales bacterium]
MPLPPRKTPSAAVRSFPEEQYWRLVFPTFDPSAHRLMGSAHACTGQDLLSDPLLKDASPTRGSWPLETKEGDIVFGAGGDHLRVLWLRSHRFPDGSAGGVVALTRVLEDFAEVYAVGVFRGPATKTALGIERLGGDVIVTVKDDTCTGRAADTACEARMQLLLPRRGLLRPVATLSLEQVAFASGTEPGELGRIEYHLTSSPRFVPNGLKLLEQVQVADLHGRVLRKAELERVFTLDGERPMTVNEAPLWPRIFPKSVAPVTSNTVL